MRHHKYRTVTYVVLLAAIAASGGMLVAALMAEPPAAADPERLLTGEDGAPSLGLPEGGGFFWDHRTPIIVVSASTVGILVGLLAMAGGVKYIDRTNVLKSPVRKEMFEFIRANPGVYLREISRRLDINPTNTMWHLRKLTEAELIRCQLANGLKVYYPLEGGVKTRQQAIVNSILRNDNARTIVAFLAAHPGAHQREIARALGVNHGTVRWHLKKLVEADITNEHRDGSQFKYFLSTGGLEMVAKAWPTGPVGPGAASVAAAALGEPPSTAGPGEWPPRRPEPHDESEEGQAGYS